MPTIKFVNIIHWDAFHHYHVFLHLHQHHQFQLLQLLSLSPFLHHRILLCPLFYIIIWGTNYSKFTPGLISIFVNFILELGSLKERWKWEMEKEGKPLRISKLQLTQFHKSLETQFGPILHSIHHINLHEKKALNSYH